VSGTEDDLLGIEAFERMTQAVDRFGITLQATEQRHKTHADAQTKAATETLQAARAALGASQNALEASQAQIRSSLLWTGLAALSVLLLASVLAFYAGQSSGWDQGHAAGYASARDETAAASWANTPNGQRALALDRLGSLNKLVACSEAGWKIEKRKESRVCFAEKAPDGTLTGWLIP
jgi:hypothetical protein